MELGFCNLSIIPVRKTPEHTSEMVTQLFYGETFHVIAKKGNWSKIITNYDNYSGWVHRLQYLSIDEVMLKHYNQVSKVIISDNLSEIISEDGIKNIKLLKGTVIPEPIDNKINILSERYNFYGHYVKPEKNRIHLINFAKSFLNSPYLWGGRSSYGIDCSGFTQIVFKFCGFNLPRDAYQQAEIGETLNFIEETEPGDLTFFDNDDGKIIHVGIVLENTEIIHASGFVKIDILDNYGIYNSSTGKYTHNLRLIKRIL